jgi:hypothetical protein
MALKRSVKCCGEDIPDFCIFELMENTEFDKEKLIRIND